MVRDEGSVPKVRDVFPVVPASQVEVKVTGPEIWLTMLGFPTACTYST